MGKQPAFQQILSELCVVNDRIILKLPASRTAIQRQIEQITTAQQQLESLRYSLFQLSGDRPTPPTRQARQTLLDLTNRSAREADNFKLLAEEFAVDPQGTLSCLYFVVQRHTALAAEIQRLQAS